MGYLARFICDNFIGFPIGTRREQNLCLTVNRLPHHDSMAMQSTSNRFEKHSKKVLIVLFLLFTLILDFGLTAIYHLYKYGTIHKYAPRRAVRERSLIFHHTLKPNMHHSVEQWGQISHSLTTNSLGFKDRDIREVPLHSQNYRFLFMGDSFTEGVGYDYERTFVGIIDEALKGDNIEVLNAAVGSYSPTIYFKKTDYLLNTVGLKVDHLVVFLDISDIQDEKESYEIRDGKVVWLGGRVSKIKDFVFEYTGLLKNIWTLALNMKKLVIPDHESLRSDQDRKYGANQYRSLWTIRDDAYEDYGRDGLRKAEQYMDQLYHLTQQHHIPMTLAVYPWPDQILHHDLDSLQVQFWNKWSGEHSVVFINFFPDFIQPEINPKQVMERYFLEGDVHWNERGHKLMAGQFLKRLKNAFPQLFLEKSGS